MFTDVYLARVGFLVAEFVKSSPRAASALAAYPSALGGGME